MAKELQPKVVIAENVKGLLLGNAIEYVRRIYKDFDEAGYYCQHWLLDASKMGVPQKRERVFFVCLRKDLSDPFLVQDGLFEMKPSLTLDFNEGQIPFAEIYVDETDRCLTGDSVGLWEGRIPSDIDLENVSRRQGRPNYKFNWKFLKSNKVTNTITSTDLCVLYDYPRHRNRTELLRGGTFPRDYNFGGRKEDYLIGMSVPPVMMAQIASNVFDQWISKL